MDELVDPAGPPVRDDERQRVGVRRANVQVVDALAVDGGGELRPLVQLPFARPPVVAAHPALGERPHGVDPDALSRIARLGPPRARYTAAQVVELRLGDVDPEPLRRHRARTSPRGWPPRS